MKRENEPEMIVEYKRAEPKLGDEENVCAGYAILFEAVLAARSKRMGALKKNAAAQ